VTALHICRVTITGNARQCLWSVGSWHRYLLSFAHCLTLQTKASASRATDTRANATAVAAAAEAAARQSAGGWDGASELNEQTGLREAHRTEVAPAYDLGLHEDDVATPV
jgi:hypothetical protein